MKKILFIYLFSLISSLGASEWSIKNIHFQTENDSDTSNDCAYSYGSNISVLFLRKDLNKSILQIPFTNNIGKDNYISFGFTHKIYTPADIEDMNLILDDRPYAGYMNLQSAIYQSHNNNLKSMNIQLGVVGPSANMKNIQKFIHDLIGSPDPQGWDYQLDNEIILQFNYSEKQYYNLDNIFGFDLSSSIIPEYGFELGNASTKVYIATLFRYGLNVSKDYGTMSINNTTYNKIPLHANENYKNNNRWEIFFNLSTKVNLIARDIFLDGNMNGESHSVDKEIFVVNATYGLTIAYNQYSVDYVRTHTSKEFKNQKDLYNYGSILFSYNF